MASVDAAAFRSINGGFHAGWLDRMMLLATAYGLGWTQSCLCLILVAAGWAKRAVRWRQAGYAGLVACAGASIALNICKVICDRPRPLLSLFDVHLVGRPLFAHSFPSGHTTIVFAVAIAAGAVLPRLSWLFAPALATAVSRVYLGVHFPLDVICGGCLGALIGLASAGYWTQIQSRKGILEIPSFVSSSFRAFVMKIRPTNPLLNGYILLALFCGVLFFWRLGASPLIGYDESVYAECSREMAASGNYVVPTVNGQPFYDKPPLVYWLQAASIRALGATRLR